jgi:AcrR family transcriptional regulator
MMAGETNKGRTRRSAAERKRQMIEAADAIINRDRSADVSMREIADKAGIGRALAYAYYPDRFRLLDALLQEHVDSLQSAGIIDAAKQGGLVERACTVSRVYLRHVAAHGTALEVVLRDEPLARQLDGAVSRLRARIYQALVRAVRAELHMSAKEALALVQLLGVIPEEAAKHVRSSVLSLEEALALNDRLLTAALMTQMPRLETSAED